MALSVYDSSVYESSVFEFHLQGELLYSFGAVNLATSNLFARYAIVSVLTDWYIAGRENSCVCRLPVAWAAIALRAYRPSIREILESVDEVYHDSAFAEMRVYADMWVFDRNARFASDQNFSVCEE